jgi:hypothetical protein
MGRLFNVGASIILVLASSGVMAWLMKEDVDSAVNFVPVFVMVLMLIGGLVFAGKDGKWITAKVIIQGIVIFIVLPIVILVYAMLYANTPKDLPSQHEITNFETNTIGRVNRFH